MTGADDGPPPETAAAIHEATGRALTDYGYAGLSMAKVAGEFDGSQSLLHYHYDTKEGLIATFLEREREWFRERVDELPSDPDRRLDRLLVEYLSLPDAGSTTPGSGDDARVGLLTAFLELHARAPHSEAIRRELAAYDELVLATVRDTVADGIDAGTFDSDADPEAVARAVLAAHDSAAIRRTLDGEPTEVRATLERYVLDDLRT